MVRRVAIVTGAASGVGLALTHSLVSTGWDVVMVDVKAPESTVQNTIFLHADVSSWEDLAAMFATAFSWRSRLDFCALNAGIDDRDDIFYTLSRDVDQPPRKPDMQTFDVNLSGVYYGIKLAAHYMTIVSPEAGKTREGGKIVVTASAGGIYPLPATPQYCASKHALIGLVRALGMNANGASACNITINAVCPALLETALVPPEVIAEYGKEQVTPMDTIMRCFEELALLSQSTDADWVNRGYNGRVVEGNLKDLIWHDPPARPAQSKYASKGAGDVWAKVYKERNSRFTRGSR